MNTVITVFKTCDVELIEGSDKLLAYKLVHHTTGKKMQVELQHGRTGR